jgi:hypothetical protein
MAQKPIQPKMTGVPKTVTAQMPPRKTASIVGGEVGNVSGIVTPTKALGRVRVPGQAG